LRLLEGTSCRLLAFNVLVPFFGDVFNLPPTSYFFLVANLLLCLLRPSWDLFPIYVCFLVFGAKLSPNFSLPRLGRFVSLFSGCLAGRFQVFLSFCLVFCRLAGGEFDSFSPSVFAFHISRLSFFPTAPCLIFYSRFCPSSFPVFSPSPPKLFCFPPTCPVSFPLTLSQLFHLGSTEA